MPAELLDAPELGDLAREYARLHDEYDAARVELVNIKSRGPAAEEADRAALAAACAAGKPDPGTAHVQELKQATEAQRRRVVGLAYATRAAFGELCSALYTRTDACVTSFARRPRLRVSGSTP
jgi:hypothetical protein